ncbi:hypothetical protein GLOIN_2v1871116 [Rhizophagus irregularis DAOM 181602=DAOM 197198]|uniref:Uncharacterized protein n=1 Tax=Rhizophagus irregularis (strain DAOM 181602 / DAOM 197198 / MUCL 43194) TaxID=747089 RepID=A0A2P4QJ62_RHIID|nr:hypothetical protein GLOIN_2v1871116 [Rhizophagus irregularis DAOM 181602=DAOM 197198]POG77660.1 hypothetical protein GLOIN_2v1871116 [Rhizophagus irregularis DAOM 181602=DAOM 197198]|eukprot:XP_025184526.1 hypothetical protein GLOIN_2v1871116 [Rhizophagus irregularis DAOM 181602=DAOM 197198]
MRRLRILSLIIRTLTFRRLTSLTMNETGLKHVTTEDDIKEKLGGEQLIPIFLVKGCFEKFIQRNIHVIVQVPATDKFLRVKGSHERLKMKLVANLGSHIVEGKFCLFHGHRQSGKMTAAWELKRLTEFWRSVCVKVKSAIPAYVDEASFSTKLKNEKIRASAFEGLFNKDRTSLRDIILIIDEASRPINDNETSWSYSFFAEVKDLLAQYAEDNKFEIEVDNIAADVYSLTLGHKGLVGNCCYYFEQKIMSGAIKATLDD